MGMAWHEALAASGIETRVATMDDPTQHWGPARSTQFLRLRRDPPRDAAALAATKFTPDVVFVWWGLGMVSAELGYLQETFSDVPLVLCVDTYPNASVLATEIREWARFRPRRRDVAGFVTTGAAMTEMLRHRRLIGGQPTLELTQPLPLGAHASTEPGAPVDAHTMLFSGRSDYLYSRDRRMAKDALGKTLERFMRAGMQVTVQEPLDGPSRSFLEERGYAFYPRFSNDAMVDGQFSDFTAGFECQLVSYEIPSGVIRRRVDNGLSTRWAFGLASPAPLVAPEASSMARAFLATHPVGVAADDPDRVMSELGRRAGAMRTYWHQNHQTWSAEGLSASVREFFASIA